MCFIKKINKKIELTPLIAEENILVYKCINKNGGGCYRDLKIKGNIELWTRGYHYTETTPFEEKYYKSMCLYIDGNCFHSCKDLLTANQHVSERGEYIVSMIIPKGSLYYENGSEYVSSDIIFPKRTSNYVKIKRKPNKTS